MEGRFEYLSSGAEPSFSYWASRQPDDYMDREDCVLFWFNSNSTGLWNDGICHTLQYFLCEQPVTGLCNQLVESFLNIDPILLFSVRSTATTNTSSSTAVSFIGNTSESLSPLCPVGWYGIVNYFK